MGWDRRSVLAAGVGLLAGCNSRRDDTPDRTATAVDVPIGPGEALAAAARVPVPATPAPVVVSAAHRRTIDRCATDRIRAARRALAAADDVELDDVIGLWNPQAPFQAGHRAVDAYRTDPSPRRFAALLPRIGDAATIHGHVRAARGDLGVDAVRAAYRTTLDRYTSITEGVEFRLATPVAELFPTVHTAVDALERARTQRDVARRGVAGLDGAGTSVLASTVAAVELLRVETTNAAGYLRTTLDPDAAARRDAIGQLAATHTSALASSEGVPGPPGRRLPQAVRRPLVGLRSRRSRLLAADPVAADPSDRVELLLDALDVRGQLAAFVTAGAATYPRSREPGVPPERVPAAKRGAVERLEQVADAPALQRQLARRATEFVTAGDTVESAGGSVALETAHFFYVAADTHASLAIRRGQRVAAALESGITPDASDPS